MATAQTSGDLKVEVASVKPAGPEHDGPSVYRVGPGTDDPERIMFERQSMLRLLGVASGFDWDQISAPAWVANEYYEINAKVPPGTTKEQVKVMWRNLLAERFNLKFHVAAENRSGYVGYMSAGRVVDNTGLPGTYDFTLEFTGRLQSGAYPPPLPDGQTDIAPSLFDAIRQQLGLQLEEKKEKLPVLVVDHLDRVPAKN